MQKLVILFIALLATGCSNELDRPVKIVLPNDYRGEFTIVKDQSGTPFTLTEEYYIFVVPPSGELRTPDIDPFFKWHKLRVEYADGRVLLDYSQDLYANHGMKVEGQGVSSGQLQTGPMSSEGSTDLDGTTLRWEVVEAPNQRLQ